ncbi:hypothetical protein [Nocardia asiatica]|uniref:hypothetical protein n=1 Tax=Nocardia asiatica TaxID=209252 RepID=UPI0002D53627|nr:hypothetical protein [Nocardia asiatica]
MSGRRNSQQYNGVRRPDALPEVRYPARPTIEALLPAMIARRSSAPATDPDLVHIWGFTGIGENDTGSAAGFAEFSPGGTGATAGSPILDIAARMMAGMYGRLWGFGLAHRAAADAVAHGIDSDADEAVARPPSGSPGPSIAEEVWAASIFDARGREFTQLRYVHLAELEPITFDGDTLEGPATVRDWIDRVATGVVSAHVWAAALALDADRNGAILGELERRLLG